VQPIVRQLSAAALACSGAYAASINYEQYRKFPSTPTAVRMEQAGQHLREWVVVSDVAYDCNQSFVLEWFNYVSRQHTKSYYVVISDQRGEHQSGTKREASSFPLREPLRTSSSSRRGSGSSRRRQDRASFNSVQPAAQATPFWDLSSSLWLRRSASCGVCVRSRR
jgi:hypothetical protein